ncbi:MAG: MFS transporter [Sulfolobaceae archaeon]|nr:MFS transporter [Sulfolobaceae archaeon]
MADKDIYLLMSSRILRSVVAGFLAVIIGLYFLKIGLNDFQIGILFGIGAFATPLLSFIFSIYADRYGRKLFLLIALAFLPIAILILLFTTNFALLALSSALGGFGIAGGLVGGGVGAVVAPMQTALLAEKSKKEDLTRIYSLFTTFSTYSGAFGALLANIRNYNLLFILGLILSLGSFAVVIPVKEERQRVEHREDNNGDEKEVNKRDMDVIKKFTFTGILNGVSQGLIVPFIPIIFKTFYGLTQAEIGDIVFIGGIVSASVMFLTPMMNEKLGFVKFIISTRMIGAVLVLIFPFLKIPLIAAVDYILFTTFRVFALPAQQALMMVLVSGKRRATASGTNQTARLLPSALSTVLSGFLLSLAVAIPFALSFFVNVANAFLYYKFFWDMPEAKQKRRISARTGFD